jgi:hypothetical protein
VSGKIRDVEVIDGEDDRNRGRSRVAMSEITAPNEPRIGPIAMLWPLALIALLLLLDAALPLLATGGTASTVVDKSQKTSFVIVLVLAFVGFGRLVPVLWSLCLASAAGLLIAAEVGLVLWFVYGGLTEVGMPGLFWHHDRSTQVRAAFGVTLFVYWMLYLLFIRDFEDHRAEPVRQIWVRFRPLLRASGLPALLGRDGVATDAVGQLRWFLLYAGLPALLFLALPAILPAMRPGPATKAVAWPWLFGMATGAVVVGLIVWTRAATRLNEFWRFVCRRSDFAEVFSLDPARIDPHSNTKNILVLVTTVFLISYLDESIGFHLMRWLFPAAFSICVVLGVLATAATWVAMQAWPTRIALGSTVVALLAAAGTLDYEVEFRDLADRYPSWHDQLRRWLGPAGGQPARYKGIVNLAAFQRKAMKDSDADEAHRVREELLENWRKSFGVGGPSVAPDGRTRPILVVVTTSGGALRAGAWTESVLGHLDGLLGDFPHHVRLMTGASGGMLGAARFVTSEVTKRGMPGGPPGAPNALDVPPDYLTRIAWQIAFRDFFPNSLIPRAMYNRGDALEDAWAEVDAGINTTFAEIKGAEEAGRLPSIVFSPMMPEDGRRLLISNLPLADLTLNNGRTLVRESRDALRKDFLQAREANPDPGTSTADPDDYDLEYPDRASVSAVEFFPLLSEESRGRLRLASAVRMSATFPYVTSSAVLPTFPPRHVVDAGYYDNFGVNLAGAWAASHSRWLSENTSGVLFVQIRAFPNEKRLKVLDQSILPPPRADNTAVGVARSWFEWAAGTVPRTAELVAQGLRSVFIPARGLAHARDSSMYFRNDAQLNGLHDTFASLTHDDEFLRTVVFTCDTTSSDPSAPNVETLNWYMDPVEYDGIRRNMGSTSPGLPTGRLRNRLRVEGLLKWWQSRGGVVKRPPPP